MQPSTVGQFTLGVGTNSDANRNDYRTDTVDLDVGALQDEVDRRALTSFTVEWNVDAQPSKRLTAYLDSIQIAIGWTIPSGFRPQSTSQIDPNCINNQSCSMIKVVESARFYVQGAGYSELGRFDLKQKGITAPVFAAGLFDPELKADRDLPDVTKGSAYKGPMINKPRPLEMLVTARLCVWNPETQDWECGEDPMGTATATYTDPGTKVTEGNREVTIDSWWIDR